MKKRIVVLYRKLKGAEKAVESLVDANFSEKKINVITNEAKVGSLFYKNIDHRNINQNAALGSIIGGAIGGVGALLGAFLISGMAPVIGIGTVITVCIGTGIGRTTGCVLGALKTLDLPNVAVDYYAQRVGQGAILVTLQANEGRVEEVMSIIKRYKPMNIECVLV